MNDGKSIDIWLYLLERQDTPHPDEWSKVLVAAKDEKSARSLANEEANAEGYVWTDGSLVSSRRIGRAIDDVGGVLISARD